ncbi:MAG: glycoside hydrolase, partial [Bacteroidales bacterium]|nr:glycoside hydrolase [Bacteroidales bacterium]
MKSFPSKGPAFITLVFFYVLLYSPVKGQNNDFSLEHGFRNPPDEALPRTWWHWTNCNVTKEGITLDLEWMKRSGIGGMHLADVAAGQGQSVEKKICFGSEEWYEAVRHAASEAERLNLEMAVFSSPGWSLTGGPWVKPEQAMKKIVWSELKIKGPQNFRGKLPLPPSNEGPFRNMSRTAKPDPDEKGFYKDCVVLAFTTPSDELSVNEQPVVSTSGGNIDITNLIDDDFNSSTSIRAGKNKREVWVQFSWKEPFTARSLTIAGRNGIPPGMLKAGNNPEELITVAVLPGPQLYRAGKVQTITFPETKAKFFRLEFTGSPMRPADVMAEIIPPPDSVYTLSELKLHSCAKIHRWEDKAGFFHLFSYEPVSSPDVPTSSSIDPSGVVDLTEFMKPDGSVEWKVPPGSWTIMRFGWSLTGGRNRPAVPSGSGYEVDKLSKEHTLEYIKNYMTPFASTLGQLYGKSLRYVMLDSWEAGMQNWTDKMLDEFNLRRGYDLKPFLPCLAGYVMGNSDTSDRVLWDFRRTLADMFAENHYGAITEYLNSQGIKTYGEASGVSLEILEDALLCKKYVDIPMGEFWYRALHPELMYYQDVRGAASAAHVYGKKIIAAESFTGGGYESPYTLKKIADYWFTQGINQIVFHTSAHQPLDTKPGNTMVGTHINRNITWSELAKPFMTFLARNSFMLQRGKFVADLAYLLDEGAPSTMPIWGAGLIPSPPSGYDYDYINADALINRMSTDSEGKLVLPDGMNYR